MMKLFCSRAIWVFAVALSSMATISKGDDTLAKLIADYKEYGLPMPSNRAELSILKWSDCTLNGVPQYRQILVLVESDPDGNATHHWIGCHKKRRKDATVIRTDSTSDSVDKTQRVSSEEEHNGFDTFPDVALAVHCVARGWDDLARALLERSRHDRDSNLGPRWNRSSDSRAKLAALAWNYWCDQFCTRKRDRQIVVEQLLKLRDGPHGLNSQSHQNIITDMQRTLTATESPVMSAERLIDDLIDVGIDGDWQGQGIAGLNRAGTHDSFRKLQQMGLEAVPTLIEHTNDFRITRCVERDIRGVWHVRIADVVRELLNGLVEEEFAYDFLIRKGRGRCVDQAHVLYWWSDTKQVHARKYLFDNALSVDADGTVNTNSAILHAMAHKYPSDLVKLYSENIERVQYPYALFVAIGKSKVPNKVKARLFIDATGSHNSWARESALRELLRMKHAQAVPMLIKELRAIPKTPDDPYWLSTAGRFAGLLCHTDDDRAWIALVENSKRVDIGQRLQMIQAIGARSARRDGHVVRFLSAFLDDEEVRVIDRKGDLENPGDPKVAIEEMSNAPFSGPSAGFIFDRLSVRDFAALQLASKLQLSVVPDSSWNETDWKNLRTKVREAMAKLKP